MITSRAIVIFFTGGEVTPASISKINQILRMDNSANASNVTMATYDINDLSKLIANSAAAELKDNDTERKKYIQIRIKQNPIDEAVSLIKERYKQAPTKYQILIDYLQDPKFKKACLLLNELNKEELKEKGFSAKFIVTLREVTRL